MTNLPSACSKASTTLNVIASVANGPRPPPPPLRGPAITSFRFLGRLFPGPSTGVNVIVVPDAGVVGLPSPLSPATLLPVAAGSVGSACGAEPGSGGLA